MCPLFFIFFTKWQPLNNYKKCFLFHLKCSFHCQDIQIFVFASSPLFFPVSHWLRGWWKINSKVYGVSNCLKKNLQHILFDILRRKKDITLNFANWKSIKSGTFLCKNDAENMHQKLVLDPFLVLVNNPKQPLYGRNCFKNKIFWKRIIKKPFKS